MLVSLRGRLFCLLSVLVCVCLPLCLCVCTCFACVYSVNQLAGVLRETIEKEDKLIREIRLPGVSLRIHQVRHRDTLWLFNKQKLMQCAWNVWWCLCTHTWWYIPLNYVYQQRIHLSLVKRSVFFCPYTSFPGCDHVPPTPSPVSPSFLGANPRESVHHHWNHGPLSPIRGRGSLGVYCCGRNSGSYFNSLQFLGEANAKCCWRDM